MPLNTELTIATSLARKAGNAIMRILDSNFSVEQKITHDNQTEPVTIADRLADQIIVDGLRSAFPDDGILSEESPDTTDRLGKSRLWLIDPIDGTKGFIGRNGDFGVQIGLAENGSMILGIVYLPFTDILYYATVGNGAFIVRGGGMDEPINVSKKVAFDEMTAALSRDHLSPRMAEITREFGFLKEVKRGSVGLKVGLIAEQICDIYFHLSPRTKHWDTAAPEIILREAGGELTDLFGERIIYNTKEIQNLNGILATNGVSHEAAKTKLVPLLAKFGRLKEREHSCSRLENSSSLPN